MRRKEFTVPTILGLLVATIGLVSGLWLVQKQKNSPTEAVGTESPTEVKISNINESGFNVSWVTSTAVSGFIQYGESTNTPDLVASDERDSQKGSVDNYFTHYVTLKGLKPATAYSFKIGSGKGVYDDNGKVYQVTTGSEITNTPAADVAYGQIVTESNEPADGAIVYLQLPNSGLLSGLVKASGAWVIPMSTARTTDGNSYVTYTKSSLINISVTDATLGKSTSITTAGAVNPVPEMALGKVYDFTVNTLTASESAVSKFSETNPAFDAQINNPTKLNILTPKLGEKVNSTKPEIQGQAPAGTKVTVEIHSDTTIKATVTANKDGVFTYSVPNDLTPGEHTITISAVVDGVTQTITRMFTVYAAGESSLPAYSSTPSANLRPLPSLTPTLQPSPTPTPTLKPSPTPVPTAIPAPTATTKPVPSPTPGKLAEAVISPTATLIPAATVKPTTKPTLVPTAKPTPVAASMSAIPVSGNSDWTWLTLIIGAGAIISGVWWYRRADY